MYSRRLAGAAALALGAQAVALGVGAASTMVLASYFSPHQYGEWQLYIMLTSYSGLFHLGLCDGAYMRLGGAELGELDTSLHGTLFRRMTAIQLIISFFGVLALGHMGGGSALIAVFLYMPVFNAAAYLGSVCQATDNTVSYSISVMIDRLCFGCAVGAAVLFGARRVEVVIFGSILARLLSLGYLVFKTRGLVFGAKSATGVGALAREDMRRGFALMCSNLLGTLVTNAPRLAVVAAFGKDELGRMSLAMTLAGILVQFASQLTMVLFPSLRRSERGELDEAFLKIERTADIVLPLLLLTYLPLGWAISVFFSGYALSIRYLVWLLPLCLLDCRTQLVSGAYLKVRGRVGSLLRLNIASGAVCLAACFAVAYAVADTQAVLCAAAVTSAVRCIGAEWLCRREGGRTEGCAPIVLICFTFAICAELLPTAPAITAYVACCAVYLVRQRGVYCLTERRGRILRR